MDLRQAAMIALAEAGPEAAKAIGGEFGRWSWQRLLRPALDHVLDWVRRGVSCGRITDRAGEKESRNQCPASEDAETEGKAAVDDDTPAPEDDINPPDVDITRPSDRKQVNLPKETLVQLERLAAATGRKVTTLAGEAAATYVQLMADANSRGELRESKTGHRLRRLSVDLQMTMGQLVRLSAHIGCQLMEEPSIHRSAGGPAKPGATSDSREAVLFHDLVEAAQAQNRPVAELVAEFVRRGLEADAKSGNRKR